MALFQKKQFEELADAKGDYCISIYVPTHRVGENKESKITLKNHVAKIDKELTEFGLKKAVVNQYLEPIRKFLDNSSFWRFLSDTLVIFRNKNKFTYHNLPLQTPEFSIVSDQFYLVPMLDIFNQNDSYFIFLLSLNKNKLYEATQHEIAEVETNGAFPGNLHDSAGYDVVQKSLEFRSRMAGKEFVPFHGKGGGKDFKETEVMKYMTDIDNGFKEILEGYRIPVVIAAVEDIFSQLKDTSSFKHLYPKCVTGNFDNDDILFVHQRANELLEPYFDKVKNEKREKYLEAPDNMILSNPEDVIKAVHMGQVDTLFVEKGSHLWGDFNEETGEVIFHDERKPLGNCLVDFAARQTFFKNGQVFIQDTSDMPESHSPLNAILRFQV
jgi:hypothetical protein